MDRWLAVFGNAMPLQNLNTFFLPNSNLKISAQPFKGWISVISVDQM